jgi:hypothetical protein
MAPNYSACVAASFFSLIAARDITFPPISGFAQQAIFGQDAIDITTGSAFAGLSTYANLPYVQCLAGDGVEVEKYDIAILGAPFDTVSWFSSKLVPREHSSSTRFFCPKMVQYASV